MSHEIVKCSICKKIIAQCRCMDCNKEVRWEICEECQDIQIIPT